MCRNRKKMKKRYGLMTKTNFYLESFVITTVRMSRMLRFVFAKAWKSITLSMVFIKKWKYLQKLQQQQQQKQQKQPVAMQQTRNAAYGVQKRG